MAWNTFQSWWRQHGTESDRALLSQLHPEPRFRAILDVERMRVDRASGAFALAVLDFGDDRRSFLLFAQFLAGRVRATDHAGLLGGGRIGVILWNTDREGAIKFVDSLKVAGQSWTHPVCEVYVYPWDEGPEGRANRLEEDLLAEVHTVSRLLQDSPHSAAPIENVSWSVAEADKSASGSQESAQPAASSPVVVRSMDPFFQQPLPLWKRTFDIIAAGGGLLALAPLFAVTALLVRWTSRGPAFFSQTRTGLGGRVFTIYKFRTMCVDAEAKQAELRKFSEQDGPAFKMTHDPRVTPIGRFLRKSCIDELPQLWNVLTGDMTLVGPRPLPCSEQAACSGWQQQRLDVTPGLTCIWQVHGKSRVTFTEWMRMDIRYIKARTFVQDVKLVFQTIWAVLLHRASC